ncbi:MAG: hypothetical protein AB2L09_09525 [Coriobacteriia bacterium]
MKKHPTRTILAKSIVTLAATALVFSIVACSSAKTPADTTSNESRGTLQGAPSSTGKYTTTAPETPSDSEASPTYSGTDPEQILSKLCALSGCHDLAELQTWTADSATVQETVDGMAGISKLTDEQTSALVEYYNSK